VTPRHGVPSPNDWSKAEFTSAHMSETNSYVI
jgi:hypothetical protein